MSCTASFIIIVIMLTVHQVTLVNFMADILINFIISSSEYKQHSELNFKHSDLEYSEKQPTLRAAESYATLASFTQVFYRVFHKIVPEPLSSGVSIYPKVAAKPVSSIYNLLNLQKKICILSLNSITNINICTYIHTLRYFRKFLYVKFY